MCLRFSGLSVHFGGDIEGIISVLYGPGSIGILTCRFSNERCHDYLSRGRAQRRGLGRRCIIASKSVRQSDELCEQYRGQTGELMSRVSQTLVH